MESFIKFLPLSLQELPNNAKGPTDYPAHEDPMDECVSDPDALDNSVKDFNGLTDIYWVYIISITLILFSISVMI